MFRHNNKDYCEENASQPQLDDVVINNRFEFLNDENMNCCNSTLPKQIPQVSQKTQVNITQPEQSPHGILNTETDNTQTSLSSQSHTQTQLTLIDDKCDQYNPNIDPGNNNSHKQSRNQSVILIGDSIIKNITPHKLSKKKVYKFTYPGKSVEEIQREIQSINTDIPASHVIIHCGTNNIPTDQQDTCLNNIEQLCGTVANKFPNAQIGVSSITARYDIQALDKIKYVNDSIKEMCNKHSYVYIQHTNIDETCLNGSRLHLNGKGTALLACGFIRFLRGMKSTERSHDEGNFQSVAIHHLKTILKTLTKRQNR